MGRHGGRADRRYRPGSTQAGPHGAGAGVLTPPGGVPVDTPSRGPRPDTTTTSAADLERWWRMPEAGAPAAPAPARPPMPEVWWDEAPVPPPVVVAAADPGLVDDPREVTAVFRVSAQRAATPPLTPSERALRDVATGGITGLGEAVTAVDGGTGERRAATTAASDLVRPYVTGPVPMPAWAEVDPWVVVEPSAPGLAPAGPSASFPEAAPSVTGPVPAAPAPVAFGTRDGDGACVSAAVAGVRRARPGRRPLGEVPVPGEAQRAPRGAEDVVSLFEPVRHASGGAAGPDAPWASPSGAALPSRRELRTKQRPASQTRAVTGKRLAKGGVLAVTAFGVVATAAPSVVSSLGVGGGSAAPLEQALADVTPLGAAGSGAGSVSDVMTGAPLKRSVDAVLAERRREVARTADRASRSAQRIGKSFVDYANDLVRLEAERKAKIARKAVANVVRDPRAYAKVLLQQRGWSSQQFTCLNLLWNRESGWNYRASNPSSGAYGIPQALPGSKMGSVAGDWRTNPATQIKWGLNYIAARYGTPCGAWAHSEQKGWY